MHVLLERLNCKRGPAPSPRTRRRASAQRRLEPAPCPRTCGAPRQIGGLEQRALGTVVRASGRAKEAAKESAASRATRLLRPAEKTSLELLGLKTRVLGVLVPDPPISALTVNVPSNG